MGGFKPSRADIEGDTTVGSVQTDLHQFTGSVDITGSLKLNGSSVTGGGGGGGAVANYTNSGNNRVITSVDSDTINGEANLTFDGTKMGVGSNHTPTAVLHVSSSTTTLPLLRVDQHDQAGSHPILYVTGSGLVGIGTASPREDSGNTNRVHILGEEGADQGINPVVNTLLMLENNDHAGIQFMVPAQKAGQLTWGTPAGARKATYYYDSNFNVYTWEGTSYGGSRAMQLAAGGDSLNIGSSNAAHMANNPPKTEANLHISSSTNGVDTGGPVMLKIDHANSANILYVTGSGRVGIGTASPVATLGVVGDTNISEGILTISGTSDDTYLHIRGNADVGIRLASDNDNAGGENDNPYIDFYQDGAKGDNRAFRNGSIGLEGDAGTTFDNSIANSLFVMAAHSTNLDGGLQLASRRTSDDQRGARLTIEPVNANIGINTIAPLETLSISGSVALSGAFGNRAVQNLNVAGGASGVGGLVNVTAGNTIIDATGLANNAFYTFGITDGTFVGQQKNIVFKLNAGGTITNSNGAEVTGSNIAIVSPGASTSTLSVSGTSGGGSSLFVPPNAATQLLWDGTKWQVLSTTNVSYSST